MEENNVFHLAKVLQNTDNARNELQTFLQAMQTRVEQDYLQKIQAAAALQQADAVVHPPREVTLLRALRAFTDDAGKSRLDEICRSLMLFHTMGQIQQNVAYSLAEGSALAVRDRSGETGCTPSPQTVRMAGLLMMLSLTERI